MANQKTAQKNGTADDGFFTEAHNIKPFIKAAIEGFAGSGKTYTAGLFAKGLHKRLGSKKPVIIFDTETAAKFLRPMFDEAGVPLLVRDSRSLSDLMETMRRAREGASDVLIIDSISHVWENFLESYKKKLNRTGLQFQDWGILKPTWKSQFSDPFVRDPLHIIMCGRAGYEYENEINEETGRREIYKSGIKMRVEGETAYEPDLLIQMNRMQEMDGGNIKRVVRVANIVKDRSTLLDGKSFENPTYDDFAPLVEYALADPKKAKTAPHGNDALLFRTEEDKREFTRQRDIWLEEIEALLTMVAPGAMGKDKQYKVQVINEAFKGVASWEAIRQLHPDGIKAGYERIRDRIVKDGLATFKDGIVVPVAKENQKE